MYKKWVLLLVTGICVMQIVGCGNKSSQETSTSGEEAVVEESAGDSSANQAATEEASSTIADGEQIVFEDAELNCSLPKGFVESNDVEGLYIHKSYPTDISTISYVISESEEDITKMTQEEFKAMLEADYYDAYGDEVVIDITKYEIIKIDGRNALRITLEYEFKGVTYEQLMYMIYNGDETHILNYTQEKGGKWMEEFEKSGESISLIAQ